MVARLSFAEKELPPRARRILRWETVVAIDWGTTSACAENTGDQGAWGASHGNYLRVRGEYTYRRVRGCETRNYLRVRGEYTAPCWHARLWLELPPRARRIPNMCSICHMLCGTTSACAENTFETFDDWGDKGNYLRVRGEYEVAAGGPSTHLGTTSACAENTACVMPLTNSQGNYLRVRGEYPTPRPEPLSAWELPPRARRIPATIIFSNNFSGTTSACAENTESFLFLDIGHGNYLRVRGEYNSPR